MRNNNSVILAGNVTQPPELKTVGEKNTALCTFNIGVTEKVNQQKTKSHFFTIKAWGDVAHAAADLQAKDAVIVTGSLEFESWEKDGKKQSRVTIRAATVSRPLFRKQDAAPAAPAESAPAAGPTDDVPF